jgi:hypothetical protein
MQIGDSNTVMERGNAGLPSTARRSVTGQALAAREESAGDEAGAAVEPLEAASQDSAVKISAAGAAAASSNAGESTGGQAGDTSHADTAQGDGGDDQKDPANVSPVKSFAYGALGLERPDRPKENSNECYTAGKWLAAGLTIGGIISLLV